MATSTQPPYRAEPPAPRLGGATIDLTEDQETDQASEASASSSRVSNSDSSTTPRGLQPRADFNTLLMPHLGQAARLQNQRSPLQSVASRTALAGASGDESQYDKGDREVIELSDDEQEESAEPADHMEAVLERREEPPAMSLSQADTETGSMTEIIDFSEDAGDEQRALGEGGGEDAETPDGDPSAGLTSEGSFLRGRSEPLTPVSPPGSPPASPAQRLGKRRLEETGQEDEEEQAQKPGKKMKKKKKKKIDDKGKGRLVRSAGQQGIMSGSSSAAAHMEGQGGYLHVHVDGNGEEGSEVARAMAALSAAQNWLGAALKKSEVVQLQARVEQLEAEGRQKDEDLRDSENEVARISSELFESRTQNNESKQILIRLTKDVEGLKALVPVYEHGYLQQEEVAAVLRRSTMKKYSANEIGNLFEEIDTIYVRNAQFDPFERREGKVLGIKEDCNEKKEVEEAWGMEMWELIIDKKKELDERCPSGSYPVECLGTKDEDISLSTAVDHVGMYLRHVEAEKKTLKDKLDKLEKDFAKLKNKLDREKGQGGTIKAPPHQALRSTVTTVRARSTPGAST